MLAQVTYIQKFIMADSEDEFMPIFVAASVAFVAMSQRICRPDVGCASAGRQYQTYLVQPADVVRHRLDARRPADATIFGTHITDARPMPYNVRPIQNQPAGLVSSRFNKMLQNTKAFYFAAS